MSIPEWTLLMDTSQPELILALCDASGNCVRPEERLLEEAHVTPNQHASRFFPVLEAMLGGSLFFISLMLLVRIPINHRTFRIVRRDRLALFRNEDDFTPGSHGDRKAYPVDR